MSLINEKFMTSHPDLAVRYTELSLKASVRSSVLMAIAGMGDALLYAYLPVKGEALGLSLFSIGFLLSINKFARFFTNRWVAWISHHWGIRNVLLAGVLLSAGTTFIYGMNPSLWIWVTARLLWGTAYSALRFSTIQYAHQSGTPGSALGIGRSIQEAGPLVAYWIGPAMLVAFGPEITFSSWAILLIVLLPIFQLLPHPSFVNQTIKPFSFQLPTWIDAWVFVAACVAEGILLVGISKLIKLDATNLNEVIITTAFYISIRRLMNIVLSPISGWLSDRFGFRGVFQASCIVIPISLIVLGAGQNELGILLAFLGSSVNSTLIPLLAQASPSKSSPEALTRMSTSRDIGSAVGALTGLSLLSMMDYQVTFLILALIMLSIWFKIRKIDLLR